MGHLLINIPSAQDVLHVYMQLSDVFNVIHLYVVSAFCQWAGLDFCFFVFLENHKKTSKLTFTKLNPRVDKWSMEQIKNPLKFVANLDRFKTTKTGQEHFLYILNLHFTCLLVGSCVI